VCCLEVLDNGGKASPGTYREPPRPVCLETGSNPVGSRPGLLNRDLLGCPDGLLDGFGFPASASVAVAAAPVGDGSPEAGWSPGGSVRWIPDAKTGAGDGKGFAPPGVDGGPFLLSSEGLLSVSTNSSARQTDVRPQTTTMDMGGWVYGWLEGQDGCLDNVFPEGSGARERREKRKHGMTELTAESSRRLGRVRRL
jgi:hypothetical protein